MSAVNLLRWMRPQGPDRATYHRGKVIKDDDPKKLGRVRVRVPLIMDGVEDDDLPWAACLYNFFDFIKDEDPAKRSGIGFVPTKDSKVIVQFMDGDIHCPIVVGCYPQEESGIKNELEAGEEYPSRAVVRLSGGTYLVIDTKTKEIWVNTASDFYLTVLGDVHETVVGSKTTKIVKTKDQIPEYIRTEPKGDIDKLEPKRNKKYEWEGLTDKTIEDTGNYHIFVEGDFSMEVKGKIKTKTHDDSEEEYLAKQTVKVTDDLLFTAQNIYHQEN